jgi:hypothetical protein
MNGTFHFWENPKFGFPILGNIRGQVFERDALCFPAMAHQLRDSLQSFSSQHTDEQTMSFRFGLAAVILPFVFLLLVAFTF